jgi:peptide deformylase
VSLLQIRVWGDPVLTNRTTEVTAIDKALNRVLDDMLETMYEAPGVGLAANQVGISKRFFVYDAGDGPNVMINPEILEVRDEWTYEEGCLSVPGYWWEIDRPGYVVMRGLDRNGREQTVEGDELLGRVLQHEFDHLEGHLLLDRLRELDKAEAQRNLRESLLPRPE